MTEEKKMKCLIYVTKSKPWLFFDKSINYYSLSNKKVDNDLNGKIVAEFDGEVEEITHGYGEYGEYYQTKTLGLMGLREHSCISSDELSEYLKRGDVVSKVGYAIHIKNLNVFDKPKKISDFYKRTEKVNPDIICAFCTNYPFDKCKECRDNYDYFNLKKAPQNMMYVYDYLGNKYVLISIRPYWACKILNGEKTIEVRKQVLNCMKGN